MKTIGWWLYQPYKWLFLLPFFAINTFFFATLAILISIVLNDRIGSKICGIPWAKINTILTPAIIDVQGKNHIKKRQSYVIVSNHLSAYDILVLYGWLGIDFKWVMKKEVRKIPGIGYGSAAVGHIFIDRSNSKAAVDSINAAKNKIKDGICVVFFPEGTRSRDGKMLPFKKGAFRFAIEIGLPILPVTISGSDKVLPSGSVNLLPGRVNILIHKPIMIEGYDSKNLNELMLKTREVIEGSGSHSENTE
jgi:1-acyl-sn-glycerol-3-phosphate acyltransferase